MVKEIFILFICFFGWKNQTTANSISQLIADKKIEYKITVNEKSTHYIAPFVCELKNNSTSVLEINIPAGLQLIAGDSSFQNFVITRNLLAKVDKGESKKIPLSAMCIEQNDVAPYGSAIYQFGDISERPLSMLSQFIGEHHLHNPTAQFTIWELVENENLSDGLIAFEMNDSNTITMIRKNSNGVVGKFNFGERALTQGIPIRNYKGSVNMGIPFPMDVHIAMFNENGVLVKELYNNANTPSGKLYVPYKFNTYDFDQQFYTVKLIANGRILMERRIDTKG